MTATISDAATHEATEAAIDAVIKLTNGEPGIVDISKVINIIAAEVRRQVRDELIMKARERSLAKNERGGPVVCGQRLADWLHDAIPL